MRNLAGLIVISFAAACSPVTPSGGGGTDGCPQFGGSGSFPLIDDLEDGNDSITEVDERVGNWVVFNDGTGTQIPDGSGAVVPTGEGADGSDVSMRTSGTGFTGGGANLGAILHQDGLQATPCPYDASEYGGIAFLGRANAPFTDATIRVMLTTVATTREEFGGICTSGCDDHFGVDIVLTDEFDLIELPWDDFDQSGFGDEAEFDEGEALSVVFSTNGDFDFSIDDLNFLD